MNGRPFTIIGAVIAVVALGAFILLGGKTTAGIGGVATQTKAVVVAARDISLRAPITAADLTITRIDVNAIPVGAFDKPEELKGLIPVVQIYKGQPITSNLVATSTDAISAWDAAYLPIPKGYVALTLPTSEQQGVAGYIQPGDYITITAIVKVKNRDTMNVRTIYTNVHVIRIGTLNTELTNPTPGPVKAGEAPSNKSQSVSSITVIVTQCQSEYLNWFVQNETVKYTLESYTDYAPKDATVDTTCPGVDSARGVTENDVVNRWPGINN
jgi:Flp pilus assembly protein CpaB